jgi:hypothetical protein
MNTEYAVGGLRIHFESRARRRWFVTLCYVVFAVSDVAWSFLNPKLIHPSLNRWIMVGCIVVGVLFWIVFTGVAGNMRARGDERETHRREHAYFRAYFVLGIFLSSAFLAYFLFRGRNPITPLPLDLRGFLVQLPFLLLGAAGIVYLTLPQAILLWTEPDMEENPEPATR